MTWDNGKPSQLLLVSLRKCCSQTNEVYMNSPDYFLLVLSGADPEIEEGGGGGHIEW